MKTAYLSFSRNSIIAALASYAHYIRSILLVPILAKSFTPGDYGIWVQIYGTVELLTGLGTLGLERSLLRFWHRGKVQKENGKQISTVLICGLLAGLFLSAIAVLFRHQLANVLWNSPQASNHILVLLLLLPSSILLRLGLVALRAQERFGQHSILMLAESFGSILIAIGLLALNGDLMDLLLALAGIRAGLFTIAIAMNIFKVRWQLPSVHVIKPFLAYGLPLLPTGPFLWISNMSDRYVISYFLGIEEVAIYSVHYSIASFIGFFFSPIWLVLIPRITRLWEDGKRDDIITYLFYAQKYPLVVAAPLLFLLSVHVDTILPLLATDSYLTIPSIIVLIGTGILALNLATMAEHIACLIHRTPKITAVYGFSAGINVLLNIIFVPIWGTIGAAATTLVTFIVQLFILYRLASQAYGSFINWSAYGRIAIALIPMVLINWLYSSSILFSLALSSALYGIALFVTRTLEYRDFIFILKVIGIKRIP